MAEKKANKMKTNKSSARDDANKYDILVWGATGYTGQLVCEYLALGLANHRFPETFKFAIAGRNKRRLEVIKQRLALHCGDICEGIGLLEGNSANQESVDRVVSQTRVVIACAGPFALYGTPVVDACVRLGAHYVDITGETPWVKGLIEKYHTQAAAKGVRICNLCGFDSVPADIGAFMVVDYIKTKLKSEPAALRAHVTLSGNGGPSGGTAATIMHLMSQPKSELKKNMADAYLLNPPDDKPAKTKFEHEQALPRYDHDIKAWTVPFIMAGSNTRVVRRSAALLKYGANFHYNEDMRIGNLCKAIMATALMGVFVMMCMFSLTRKFLKAFVLPKPGEGPTEEQRAAARFRYEIVGKTADGHIVTGLFAGGDPGYGDTAKMVTEAGLTLALELDQLAQNPVGVVPPAVALGNTYVGRLRDAGLTLQVKKIA